MAGGVRMRPSKDGSVEKFLVQHPAGAKLRLENFSFTLTARAPSRSGCPTRGARSSSGRSAQAETPNTSRPQETERLDALLTPRRWNPARVGRMHQTRPPKLITGNNEPLGKREPQWERADGLMGMSWVECSKCERWRNVPASVLARLECDSQVRTRPSLSTVWVCRAFVTHLGLLNSYRVCGGSVQSAAKWKCSDAAAYRRDAYCAVPSDFLDGA